MKRKLKHLQSEIDNIVDVPSIAIEESVEVAEVEEDVDSTPPTASGENAVFAGMTILLNREVPRHALQFMLLAHGARVVLPAY